MQRYIFTSNTTKFSRLNFQHNDYSFINKKVGKRSDNYESYKLYDHCKRETIMLHIIKIMRSSLTNIKHIPLASINVKIIFISCLYIKRLRE